MPRVPPTALTSSSYMAQRVGFCRTSCNASVSGHSIAGFTHSGTVAELSQAGFSIKSLHTLCGTIPFHQLYRESRIQ